VAKARQRLTDRKPISQSAAGAVKKPASKKTTPITKAKAAPAGRGIAGQVLLFQPYRTVTEKAQCDIACTPIQLTSTRPDLYAALNWINQSVGSAQSPVGKAALWGIIPRDFVQRTAIPVAAWSQVVRDNPDRDVYLLNPAPAEEAIYPNPLSRIFLEFPELQPVLPILFSENHISASPTFSMAPYLVARSGFWSAYWAYIRKEIAEIEKRAAPAQRKLLAKPQSDSPLLAGDSILSLIAGALLPVFLKTDQGSAFKAIKIALPAKERELNAHLNSLRQLKDAAVKAQSPWLISCWMNYRNLYVYQVNGKQWCARHLAAITPKKANFF